jgi:cobalamin biosynthesis protein CobD/CbiB
MKVKYLNLSLILASLIGFMQWSGNNHMFLFQAEWELLKKAIEEPASVLHPFTVLPFLGQLLLLITLFQKQPNKILTLIGIAFIGVLLGLLFIIGIMSLNVRILFSTLPFLILAVLTFSTLRKNRTTSQDSMH